jgi:hypothetical protein
MGRWAWTNHIYFQITQPGSSTVTPLHQFFSICHPFTFMTFFIDLGRKMAQMRETFLQGEKREMKEFQR